VQRRSWITARSVIAACAALAAAIGVVTLVGALEDVSSLTTFAVDGPAIEANTSIALILSATALWLLGTSERGAWRRAGDLAAVLVGLIGLSALVEYVFDTSFGIDELVVADLSPGDFPGRMSPQMGIALALVATAIVCARRAPRASQVFASGSLIAAYAAVVSIVFEIRTFFGMDGIPAMSLAGAVAVSALSIGAFAMRPDVGISRLVRSRSRGGRLARIGLIVSLLLSTCFGVVVYLAQHGFDLVQMHVAASIYFLASGVFAACLVVAVGYSYDRVDRARALATEGLLVSEQQSRALIDHASEAITVLDLEANRFVRVNPAAERLFGLGADELVQRDLMELSPPRQPDGRLSSQASLEQVERALRGETPVFEWVHRDAQGRSIECEVRLLLLPHPDRTLIRGSIIDVGARKQAEMALRSIASERAGRAAAEYARDQQAIFQRTTTRLLAASSVDEVLTIFIDEVVDEVRASSGVIFLLEGDELVRRRHTPGAADERWARVSLDADLPSAWAVRSREPQLFLPGEGAPTRHADLHEVMRSRGEHAWGAFPMVVQGEVLGVVAFGFTAAPPDDWGTFLGVIATRVGMALERARLYEAQLAARAQLEQAAERATALQKVLEGLASATTRDEVIEITATLGIESLGAVASTTGILDDEAGDFDVRTFGFPGDVVPRTTRLAIDAAMPGPASLRGREALWFRSGAELATQYPATQPFVDRSGIEATACVPLLEWGRPIGFLAAHYHDVREFTEVDRVVFTTLASVAAQALSRASRFETEHQTAMTLQQSLLPARVPTATRASIAARYSSAGELEVGGDWYDAVEQGDGSVVAMVGDVVGRGLSAATAMGQLRSALSALALAIERPREMLAALDRYSPQIDGARLATLAVARIDVVNHVFQYASAGHMPGVLVLPDGSTELLHPERSLPLDALPETPRDELERDFPPGATLVLYTDGLVERRGESLDVGFQRLTRTCSSLARLDVDDMCEHIVAALLPRQEQRDDVAVLCVRLDTEPSDALRRRFPADPSELARLRRDLREWLLQAGLSSSRADDLVLAVDEACANAVEHAYDGDEGEVVVEVVRSPDQEVVVSVQDGGRWRDTPSSPNRGRGLRIIEAVVDELDIQTGATGTTLRLRSASPARSS
jgi:PAS domain S-box-containing protein